MKSMDRRTFLGALAVLAVPGAAKAADVLRGSGGGDGRAGSGLVRPRQLSVPDWMEVDRDGSSVSMEVVAGLTDDNNYWNFNGYTNGESDIVVPAGFEIEIEFRNDDPNMAHSLGIDEVQDPWPASIPNPEPVFEGAITSSPTAMARATQSGQSETITFTAGEAGEYAMVCYIPGHATIGMWTYFVVSGDGEAGVRPRG